MKQHEQVHKLLAAIDGLRVLGHPFGSCGAGCGFCEGMKPIEAALATAKEVRAVRAAQGMPLDSTPSR